MWRLVVIVTLIACNGSGHSPDASPFRCPCAEPPANIPACSFATCGDGVVDTCYTTSPMGCHCVMVIQETCEAMTCESLGFYGGTSACSTSCMAADGSRCDACAPGNMLCKAYPTTLVPQQLSTSGSHVAMASLASVQIFDGGFTPLTVNAGNVRDLVAVPTGWLVVTATELFHLDRAGTRGTARALATLEPTAAYGAGGNVVIASTQTGMVRFTIVTTTGVEVVASTDLFAGAAPSAASDGTSFFVGAAGQLARIAANGTKTVATGFPLRANERVYVTPGWYASVVGNTLVAQPFDANGALAGSAITVDLGAPILDLVADGSDLVVLRRASHVELVRVAATGTAGSGRDVGVGSGGGQLDHMGANFVVAWSRPGNLQLALSAPP